MPGEALDCYLERVADANHLSTAALLRLLGGDRLPRFLMLAPDCDTRVRIANLTGLTEQAIVAATLTRFDGHSINLDGFDAEDRHSYRQVAARGWSAIHGSQLCPVCLASTGVWQLRWRTPYAAICVEHGTYLLTHCPGCRRPFRDQRHSPLRAVGGSVECGNPLGAGPRQHCRTHLTGLPTTRASAREVTTQQRIDAALDNSNVTILGEARPSDDYLRELRSLTVLLFHLATQRTDQVEPAWITAVQFAAAARTGDRSPRWGLRPPDDPRARAGAFAAAHSILTMPDIESAGSALTAWLDRVPSAPDGILGWLADHTQMTATLSDTVIRAHAPHRRLSHLLDQTRQLVSTAHVPQMIPDALYQQHLRGLIDSNPDTVRSFAAICLARTNDAARSWADAGDLLGIPQGVAEAAARACSSRTLVRPHRIIEALIVLGNALPAVNRREVEARVRGLRRRQTWFRNFAASRRGTRATSKGYAITWIWANVADGLLADSPGWLGMPDRRQRALYRQFAGSLNQGDQNRLRAAIAVAGHIEASSAPTRTERWVSR